jgi:hypothetical protein
LGFEQAQNVRAYNFDVLEKGRPARHFTVHADLSFFLAYHIGIQEGPTLCANKLAADLERNEDVAHELTREDLRLHADARTVAEAQRAEMHKSHKRRPIPAEAASPWRNSGFGPGGSSI